MNKFDYKKIMSHYNAFAIMMALIVLTVAGKTICIMTVECGYWTKVANRIKRDSVDIKPMRDNILSSNGELMVSSLPEFKVYMNFRALHESKTDALWNEKIDPICQDLATIFLEKPADALRVELKEGRKK